MSQSNPIETFLLEADDLLNQIEQSALDLTRDLGDREAIDQLFRAFHTIKGSGAMFGFDAVASFTHHVENALDRIRSGATALTLEIVDLLLAAKDQIKRLLEGRQDGAGAGIVIKLEALTGDPDAEQRSLVEAPQPAGETGAAEAPLERFRIFFRPAANIAATGLDPSSLLDELRALGECEARAILDDVPPLDELEPDQCRMAWDISLATDRGINAARDVFIFVEDESELSIELEGAAADAKPEDPPQCQAEDARGEPDVAAGSTRAKTAQSTVRVPSEKLDRLVNLVGELVMNQSRLLQVSRSIDSTELSAPVEAIERLISELRDSVLGIRMLPIGTTFSRFRRLVHDLSHELGKEIELVTEGEETELDKTVLDQLAEPLVHLIRNCVDHGIENPDARAAAGKARAGRVRLAAAHLGAHVVVTIQDDGRGLDAERIRAKAVEKGLIAADADLSEQELFNLIFLPGFSTAKDVTNVSGRGVGLDVVKRQLEAIGGDIKLSSKRGFGAAFALTLPLTLAIIDGLLVQIGVDSYILPMSSVSENVEITRQERASGNGRNIVNVRGELVPYLRLREVFGYECDGPEIEKIVIASFEGQRLGFVVDRVVGSHQTVIQSMGKLYEDIEVVSGATIMGDGRVALVLDVGGVVRFDAARAADAHPLAAGRN